MWFRYIWYQSWVWNWILHPEFACWNKPTFFYVFKIQEGILEELTKCSCSAVLKIVIFFFLISLLILHNLRIFWISKITLKKIFIVSLLCGKRTQSIVTVFDVKSTNFKPQTLTWTPISAPISGTKNFISGNVEIWSRTLWKTICHVKKFFDRLAF